MKKHLSLLFALLISACSGPATSATSSITSEPVISSSEESTTSIVETTTSSTSVISSESTTSINTSSTSTSNPTTSSSSIGSSSSSSSSTSSISSSTSVPTSTSSSSSSQGGEQQLSSSEAFSKLNEGLKLKNSTFVVENYIEEKLIDDKILANHYYGPYAEYYGDEGFFHYLDQGIFSYTKDDEDNVTVKDCRSLKNVPFSTFFCTTYDFYKLRNKWKATTTDYVYSSTNAELGAMIDELGGSGIYNQVAKSYSSKLEVAVDGLSATYTSLLKTDGYGDYNVTILVKDLGTTTEPVIEEFLANAVPLVSTNDFPSDVKDGFKQMLGKDLPVPEGVSYAHKAEVYTVQGFVAEVSYEDLIIGDQVNNYRQTLEEFGFTLSDETDIDGDLKEYGFVTWYYDFTFETESFLLELFFYPKINLEPFEQGLYPNGIFHLEISRK